MKSFFKDNKAQGSLELLIGVVIVIVIATIVGLYMKKTILKPQKQGAKVIDDITKDMGGK